MKQTKQILIILPNSKRHKILCCNFNTAEKMEFYLTVTLPISSDIPDILNTYVIPMSVLVTINGSFMVSCVLDLCSLLHAQD